VAKLLLIEDDREISEQLQKWLQKELHTVDSVFTGSDGLYRLTHYSYDLAIVDWNLPGVEGVEICNRIRVLHPQLPLLMLTSRSDIGDKITGLDSGALDYLVKPTPLPELSARIRSLLRRKQPNVPPLVVNDIRIDEVSRQLFIGASEVKLPPIEFDMLLFFTKHYGAAIKRNAIIKELWSDSDADANANFRVQIGRLRNKLLDSGSCMRIQFDAAKGYELVELTDSLDAHSILQFDED